MSGLPALIPPLVPRPTFGEGLRLVALPVSAEGSVLATDFERGLLCLDPVSGHTRWAVATTSGWGECLIDGTRVAAALRPGTLTLLDVSSGAVLSEADMGEAHLLLGSSVRVAGAIAGPATDGTLGVWDLAAGRSAWRRSTDTRGDVRVATGGGAVIAVAAHGFDAHDLADGRHRWHFDVSDLGARETIADGVLAGQVATPLVADEETVWTGLSGGPVIAVALNDGGLRWARATGAPIGHAIALDPTGFLVILADDQLIEVDGRSGEERRRVPVAPDWPGPFTNIALSTGHAWTVDRRGRLLAIDRADGQVTLVAETQAFVHEPPLLTDRSALVRTFEGQLLAYVA